MPKPRNKRLRKKLTIKERSLLREELSTRILAARKGGADAKLPGDAVRLVLDAADGVLQRASRAARFVESIHFDSKHVREWLRSHREVVLATDAAYKAFSSVSRKQNAFLLGRGTLTPRELRRRRMLGGPQAFMAEVTLKWDVAAEAADQLFWYMVTADPETNVLRMSNLGGGRGNLDLTPVWLMVVLGRWWIAQGWTPTTYRDGAFLTVARHLLGTDEVRPSSVTAALKIVRRPAFDIEPRITTRFIH